MRKGHGKDDNRSMAIKDDRQTSQQYLCSRGIRGKTHERGMCNNSG